MLNHDNSHSRSIKQTQRDHTHYFNLLLSVYYFCSVNLMYEFKVSTRKNKKYDVYKNGKYLLSFGDSRYQHYHDKLGYYRHLDHNDEERRERYYKRFGEDADFESAKYFSHELLW